MITRIKYRAVGLWLFSDIFVINAELAVYAFIDRSTSTLEIKNADNDEIIRQRRYKNVKGAKYAARRILKKLGMPLAQEWRIKSNG